MSPSLRLRLIKQARQSPCEAFRLGSVRSSEASREPFIERLAARSRLADQRRAGLREREPKRAGIVAIGLAHNVAGLLGATDELGDVNGLKSRVLGELALCGRNPPLLQRVKGG